MRKSNISNKSLNESPRQSHKSDIFVSISPLEGVGVKNQTDVITPTNVLADKQRVTPKSEVPCRF